MKADYFNNPLVPFKWYEVARTLERSLFKKLDVFMYLSATHDNAFELLYVSVNEINRRLTKCYHGKFVIRMQNNYLIIRNGLWRKRYLVVEHDEAAGIVILANKRKSKCWILSNKLPYDKTALDILLKSAERKGVDMSNIRFF